VRKYFILIRSFLRWADLAGFCDYASSSATPKFRTIRNPVVFLTSDELERLFSFDISPGNEDLEKARDLFCFCCSTSLRYSDMAKLKVSDISGGQIKVVTKKTDTPIIIDLNRISSKILSKYHKCIFSDGLALPSMDLKHLNSNIKKVCRMCGINTPVTKTFYVAGERKDVTLPKWKLISSHCGRRTFICYALARGVPPQIVMKWTGHSDYKAMRPYIDVAGQDCAKAMKKLFRNFDEE
ncbi:MAG: site-specific integrase, partial [Candidatus Cryptobacteroides sp.]